MKLPRLPCGVHRGPRPWGGVGGGVERSRGVAGGRRGAVLQLRAFGAGWARCCTWKLAPSGPHVLPTAWRSPASAFVAGCRRRVAARRRWSDSASTPRPNLRLQRVCLLFVGSSLLPSPGHASSGVVGESRRGGAALGALTEDIAIVSQATTGCPLIAISLSDRWVPALSYVGWLSPPVLGLGGVWHGPGCARGAIPAVVGLPGPGGPGPTPVSRSPVRAGRAHAHLQFALIEGFGPRLSSHRVRRAAFLSPRGSGPPPEIVPRSHNTAGLLCSRRRPRGSQARGAVFRGARGLLLFALPLA